MYNHILYRLSDSNDSKFYRFCKLPQNILKWSFNYSKILFCNLSDKICYLNEKNSNLNDRTYALLDKNSDLIHKRHNI